MTNPYLPPQPQPQPQYGQPVYAQPSYMAAAEPKGHSITSMVFGLSSLMLGWTLIVPLLGIIFGIVGLRKEPTGRAFALTGIISAAVTGVISLALGALFWIGMLSSMSSSY